MHCFCTGSPEFPLELHYSHDNMDGGVEGAMMYNSNCLLFCSIFSFSYCSGGHLQRLFYALVGFLAVHMTSL